jgi:hypothetical protein
LRSTASKGVWERPRRRSIWRTWPPAKALTPSYAIWIRRAATFYFRVRPGAEWGARKLLAGGQKLRANIRARDFENGGGCPLVA